MAIQKFLNLEGLSVFLDNLKSTFSPSKHTHTKSEITDLTVDSSLSATSTNPVQNSTITAALDTKVPTTRTINGKALSSNFSLSSADVGADPTGTASSAVSQHNVATTSHNDIRNLISTLSTRLNTLADSDDTTLDQLSEIVAYIKSNKDFIDAITTSKVNVDDIVNDLTTSDASKVLSAEQGVALKTLIDELKAALETVHVQADLSVNDPTDPRYVHGRTHYVEDPVETVLIPEQTVAFNNIDGQMTADSPVAVELVEGQTYIVNFDGVTYQCVCKIFFGAYPYIGSPANWGLEDTGEPFLYACVDGQNMWLAYNTEIEHVLSMTTIAREIVKIPDKFLPDYDFAGKNVSGKRIMGFDGNEYVGGTCAEIFNNLTNEASGNYSHAEGYRTTASSSNSHAEGYWTRASGGESHAEGEITTASGYVSHAEGSNTTASGQYSHAEGLHTIARGNEQHVQGKYNIIDTNNQYAHIVGNGTSSTKRSNAHTIDWNGLGWFAGGLKVGGTGQDDTNAVEVATLANAEEWVFTLEDGSTVTKKVVLG